MSRNTVIIISVFIMSYAMYASFKLKYKKEIVFDDVISQRIYAISELGLEERKIAITKLSINNDFVIDTIYNKMLNDTIFLNKIGDVLIAKLGKLPDLIIK